MPLISITFTPYYFKDLNALHTMFDKFLNDNTSKYYKCFDKQDKRTVYFISYTKLSQIAIDNFIVKFKDFNELVYETFKVRADIIHYTREVSI